MVTILQPPPRQKKFGERFAESVGAIGQELPNLLGNIREQQRQKQESAQLQNLIGEDVSSLNPELRKIALSESLKGKARQKENKQQIQQKAYEGIQTTVQEMENLLNEKGMGLLGQLNQTGAAVFNRARLKTLSSDLLNFYKQLFPRGITQQEFLKLEKDYIPKPGERIETSRGKLSGFMDLIRNKLENENQENPESENLVNKTTKERKKKYHPDDPDVIKKFNQLNKRFKGDRKKVNEALSREYEL